MQGHSVATAAGITAALGANLGPGVIGAVRGTRLIGLAGYRRPLMPSACAMPPETGIFRFVTSCGELTGNITLVPLPCRACSETVGGRSRTRWVTARTRIPFEG
jgi:hypothetical protein